MTDTRPLYNLLNRTVRWDAIIPRAWGKIVDNDLALCFRSEDPLETPYTFTWKDDVNCSHTLPECWLFPDGDENTHEGRVWRPPVHSAIEIFMLRRARLIFCIRKVAVARCEARSPESEPTLRLEVDQTLALLCSPHSQLREPQHCLGISLDTSNEIQLLRDLANALLAPYDELQADSTQIAPSTLLEHACWPEVEGAAQAFVNSLYQ